MIEIDILNAQWGKYFQHEGALDDVTHLELTDEDGHSTEALIRHQGAYILSAHAGSVALLGSPGFYPSSPFIDFPIDNPEKLDATHTASPAGIMPGQTIRQHGDSRYTKYSVVDGRYAVTDGTQRDFVVLEADDQSQGLRHRKQVSLRADGLSITDRLKNVAEPIPGAPVGEGSVRTSILEHFYIPVAESDIPGIVILDDEGLPAKVRLQPVEGEALHGGFADIADGLAEGKSYIDEQFFYGSRSFRFPDGRRITVGARGRASDSPNAGTSLVVWHRPGTESICIEPVAGLRVTGKEGGLRNNNIYIPPHGFLKLTSSIRVEGISA